MKTILFTALTIAALGASTPAIAADEGNASGCRLQGAYMSFDSNGFPVWTATYTPLTANTGVTDASLVGFDHTLGGAFPDAVRDTGLRGAWTRTGRNVYAVTLVSIAANAVGDPQYSVKLTGTYRLNERCSVIDIQLTMGLYLLGMNPLTDAPVATFSLVEQAHAIKAP